MLGSNLLIVKEFFWNIILKTKKGKADNSMFCMVLILISLCSWALSSMGYSFLEAEKLCFLRRLVPLSACIFYVRRGGYKRIPLLSGLG
jgi:hypothetical protein